MILPIVKTLTGQFNLDPYVVSGLIQVESGGNPWAMNPEPGYRYMWNVRTNGSFRSLTEAERLSIYPPQDFPTLAGDPDQEWWAQRVSWGLMQLMGAVARERGFRGKFLSELCDPEVNVRLGCLHLAGVLRTSEGDIERALATYNGGTRGNVKRPFRNQAYVDKVMKAAASLKG